MPQYRTPLRDFNFVLNEFLDVQRYADLPAFAEWADFAALLDAAAGFAEDVLSPINQTGDVEGVHFDGEKVKLPEGFVQAYRQFVDMGFPALTGDPDFGGLGYPHTLGAMMNEIISASCNAFGITPGLTHCVIEGLSTHGSEEQKTQYLEKLISGEWAGIMVLTEADAGTDLGRMRTKATPNGDGSYALEGEKIFISSGDQDATENIVHFVLAKLPGAPEGLRGISLFLVPKRLPDAKGNPGEANDLRIDGVWEKGGLHASPTCTIVYEGAKGWLVGEPHKGMQVMFTIMNTARLGVGVQGLGLAEAAYQAAMEYAHIREQGRAASGALHPEKTSDPILVHMGVADKLQWMRSFTEGARMLMGLVSLQADVAREHPDEATRQQAARFVRFMTPLVKAYFTDNAVESAVKAIQVFGGAGYMEESGAMQFLREALVSTIYEGMNDVQALFLTGGTIGRELEKTLMGDPEALLTVMSVLQDSRDQEARTKLWGCIHQVIAPFMEPVQSFTAAHAENAALAPWVKPLEDARQLLLGATEELVMRGIRQDREGGAAMSNAYLRLVGHAMLGYVWAKAAEIALERLTDGKPLSTEQEEFYLAKLQTAGYFQEHVLLPAARELMTRIEAPNRWLHMPDQGIAPQLGAEAREWLENVRKDYGQGKGVGK